MQVRAKNVRIRLKEMDKFLLQEYKENHPQEKRDYSEYEKEFKRRIKRAIKCLTPITNEATRGLVICREAGCKPLLKPNEKLKLILIHQLFGKSNRVMSNALMLFSLMTGIDVSYKTIERLYSDKEVELALFNLLILLLKKKNVKQIDACGDATGYSLMISKHYASAVKKLKEKAKEQKENDKKKCFIYKFALMDLETKMYVCFGTSMISEKRAFDKAMQMLKELGIKINSVRLDRYYSCAVYVNQFPNSKVYIIPKKNVELGNGFQWHDTLRRFLQDTMGYLEEYFKRENSESGWSSDKKLFGWKVAQKREDRMDTALFCRCIWHDLFYLF